MSEENLNVNVTEENTNEQEVKTLNVNLNLLTNIKSLLEISTSRGVFKAHELSSVGRIYDELFVLLK